MIYYFQSQVDIVAFYISFNILLKGKPKVLPNYKLSGFINSKMNGQQIIAVITNQFRLDDF